MTEFEDKWVRCSCCGKTSQQSVLLSSNEFGSRDLDQRPAEMMRSMMGSWRQECPSCGYVAGDLGKADEHDRHFVRTLDYRRLRDGDYFSQPARRFLLRAALESSKGNQEGAFDQTLCAAWVADDGSRPEQAKALRREANQYLVDRTDWLVDLQLVRLDVLRRASNW